MINCCFIWESRFHMLLKSEFFIWSLDFTWIGEGGRLKINMFNILCVELTSNQRPVSWKPNLGSLSVLELHKYAIKSKIYCQTWLLSPSNIQTVFFCYLHLKEGCLLVPLGCTILKNVKCLFVFIKKNQHYCRKCWIICVILFPF